MSYLKLSYPGGFPSMKIVPVTEVELLSITGSLKKRTQLDMMVYLIEL
jgi:hypothetical protein